MKRGNFRSWCGVGLASGAILAAALSGSCSLGGRTLDFAVNNAPETDRPASGSRKVAPDFELSVVGGNTISKRDLAGSPAVIVFWTAWCPVCKDEAPAINRLAAEYEPRGVKVIGINIGESDARINEGIADFGIKYTVAKDTDTSVAKAFRVVGTPTVIFLDRSGSIAYSGHEVPADHAAKLDELIAPL